MKKITTIFLLNINLAFVSGQDTIQKYECEFKTIRYSQGCYYKNMPFTGVVIDTVRPLKINSYSIQTKTKSSTDTLVSFEDKMFIDYYHYANGLLHGKYQRFETNFRNKIRETIYDTILPRGSNKVDVFYYNISGKIMSKTIKKNPTDFETWEFDIDGKIKSHQKHTKRKSTYYRVEMIPNYDGTFVESKTKTIVRRKVIKRKS